MEPIEGRASMLVIEMASRPRPAASWWLPLAIRWPALRCLLGWHPWPRELRLRRGPDGAIVYPAIVLWSCRRCGRSLGETNLSELGLD